LDEDAHRLKKGIKLLPKQGIKCPGEIGNLTWVNTYVLCEVMHNSIGTAVRSAETL